MRRNVKRPTSSSPGKSRISSKHQITIPKAAFDGAGFNEGDVVSVRAEGTGRVSIARVQDLIDEHAGAIASGGELGRTVRGLRDEWDQR